MSNYTKYQRAKYEEHADNDWEETTREERYLWDVIWQLCDDVEALEGQVTSYQQQVYGNQR